MTPQTSVTHRAVLTFATGGGAARLSVPRASLGTTSLDAMQIMNIMVNGGALDFGAKGKPAAPIGAKLVTTERTRVV